MSVVIYSEALGVYLGTNHGVGLWSGIDSCAQDCAPVFATAQDAYNHIHQVQSERPGAMPFDVVVTNVVPDIEYNGKPYASPAACMSAGLPGWLTELTLDLHDRFYGDRPRMH